MGEIEFDDLDFSESLLGAPAISGDDLVVPVAQLYALRGEPPQNEGPLAGRLVFCGVSVSRRDVREYVGDPRSGQGFKAPYVVEDVDPRPAEDAREFLFEGVQEAPTAWVAWTVRARVFMLELD